MATPTTLQNGTAPTVYLETFGCQMNELDSELVTGQLLALGYRFTSSRDDADVVLFNTCSVRAQAENKVLSRVGRLKQEKAAGRRVVVGLLGCLAEREGDSMLVTRPEVDLLCGPGELDRLPFLLDNLMRCESLDVHERVALQGSRSRRSTTLSAAEDGLESLDLSRAFDPEGAAAGGRTAYVRITRGCNKFCTYCVVPNTRGAEVHRPPDAIVEECRSLADQGVIEVTLLGQTVNHYVYVHGAAISVHGVEAPQVGPGLAAFRREDRGAGGRRVTTFADLLHRIHEAVPEIQRLRFVTSYPRDFGDDILHVIRESDRICPYLHVPAQSGSDRILKLMNRGYTVGDYREFIDRVQAILPDAGIAGDFIVGFPTETDADFEQTCALVRSIPFKNNFVFKYSPRPGTVAIEKYPDDVPEAIKRARINELLAVQSEVSRSVHEREIGKTHRVFVEKEGQSGRSAATRVELGWESPRVQLSGRTPGDLIAVFECPEGQSPGDLIGRIVEVRVDSASPRLLVGHLDPCEAGNPAW
ncbi:MAG: MiaB/RimO family radical SAM methylthiotransferase [Phycisphaerales bacterium]|nr:MiaB/RimO family radical SAM methylthiotransferase [Phycisphaerales bacterium]